MFVINSMQWCMLNEQQDVDSEDHFRDVTKLVFIGTGAERPEASAERKLIKESALTQKGAVRNE